MIAWKQLFAVAAATTWISIGDASLNELVGQEAVQPVRITNVAPAPSIILRQAMRGANPIRNCVVEMNPIEGSSGNEYAVRISIPDSVTVVEVLPDRSANARRNFRIRLDQPNVTAVSPAAGDSAISTDSTDQSTTQSGSRVPIRQASGPVKPDMHLKTKRHPPAASPFENTPIEQAAEPTFQANPFFETTSTSGVIRVNLTDASLDAFSLEFTTRPILASFQLPAKDAFTNGSNSVHQIPVMVQPIQTHVHVGAPLQAELFGPTALGLGLLGDFVIEVTNTTTEDVSNITLQLDVPEGLSIVKLGRPATMNESHDTVTWNIAKIAGLEKTLVRYRVESVNEGSHDQTVRMIRQGGDHEMEIVCKFATRVLLDFETLNAPKLGFETESR